jgi:hypothetical protein
MPAEEDAGTSSVAGTEGRCTAFAVTEGQAPPICAQNVDEWTGGWLDGSRDVVIRIKPDDASEPDVLLYTHPGTPAYCGMNSAGLCVMNNFIDDGLRNEDGVPIDCTLRELLSFQDINSAVQWLEKLPRAAPTTILLMQDETIACVELSARRTATAWVRGPGQLTHANHPTIDHSMQHACGQPNTSSLQRFRQVQSAVQNTLQQQGGVDANAAKAILSACPPAHSEYAPTIAAVVMQPSGKEGLMHVRFFGEGTWLTVGFTSKKICMLPGQAKRLLGKCVGQAGDATGPHHK